MALPHTCPSTQDVTAAVRVDFTSGARDAPSLISVSMSVSIDEAYPQPQELLPPPSPRVLQSRQSFLPITMLEQVPGVFCICVTGTLLFGAGEKLERALEHAGAKDDVHVVVLDMSNVTVIDSSGLEVIEEQLKRLKVAGKHLLVCGQPLRTLERAGFVEHLGRADVFRSSRDALVAAARLVSKWEQAHSEEEAVGDMKWLEPNSGMRGEVVR